MDAAIKAKWVEALRSGKYRQATGKLRDGEAFCCLGVLCDLHSSEWHGDTWKGLPVKYLPEEVMKWARLDDYNPHVPVPGSHRATDPLAWLNDNGFTFLGIAALIEANL